MIENGETPLTRPKYYGLEVNPAKPNGGLKRSFPSHILLFRYKAITLQSKNFLTFPKIYNFNY